ncbi:MAG TPA: hypothetical protein VLV18_09080 [Terriglobales bacterium]|nr:hypothetical protein [Terriglobales bacterium]
MSFTINTKQCSFHAIDKYFGLLLSKAITCDPIGDDLLETGNNTLILISKSIKSIVLKRNELQSVDSLKSF